MLSESEGEEEEPAVGLTTRYSTRHERTTNLGKKSVLPCRIMSESDSEEEPAVGLTTRRSTRHERTTNIGKVSSVAMPHVE
jgi:hypothetical protein